MGILSTAIYDYEDVDAIADYVVDLLSSRKRLTAHEKDVLATARRVLQLDENNEYIEQENDSE